MTTKSRSNLSGNDKCKEVKLPVGYRFDPTDVELLEHYLIPKLNGEKLPSEYVMDLDVYQYEPHQLPLNKFKHAKEKQAYFFTEDTRLKNPEDQVRTWCWKICNEDIPIYRNNESIIGFKTKLYFHDSNGNKTDWKMIEYRCHPNQIIVVDIKCFIICKVKQKMKIEVEHSEEESSERENGNNLANHWLKAI